MVKSSTRRVSEILPVWKSSLSVERERGFEADDAEGRAIEFHIFAGGMMRGVVGGDGVHGAIGESGNQRGAVCARSERRIHLVIGVVADVVIAEREMVRRNFAGDAHA